MQETQIRPRKGGKTARYALNIERAERVRRVIQPMPNSERLAHYEKANAGRRLTGPQVRRLARHDDAGLNGDARYMVKRRDKARKRVRQSFGDRIDNQRVPTGRTGMRRFGPALGRSQLDRLFQRAVTPVDSSVLARLNSAFRRGDSRG